MPQISLIIPVYNTEAYLAKCLTSALAQTFTDIEVICVDSSSTAVPPPCCKTLPPKTRA